MKRLVSPSPAVPDLQAVGGLYDSLALEVFPAPQPGYPAQHVYGAVRFLRESVSTFQLIAGGAVPDRATLTTIDDLVASFRLRRPFVPVAK